MDTLIYAGVACLGTIGIVSLITLLIQAIFDIKVSDNAKSSLWSVFWVASLLAILIAGAKIYFDLK